MLWFKHWSDASHDLFIQELCERYGDTGYAFWFRTLELIANQGRDGSMEIPEATWRQVTHSRRTDHLRRLYTFATERGKLEVVNLSNGLLHVKCPKFAEIADEYTRKVRRLSGHSPKSSKSTSTSGLVLESVDLVKIQEPDKAEGAFDSLSPLIHTGMFSDEELESEYRGRDARSAKR